MLFSLREREREGEREREKEGTDRQTDSQWPRWRKKSNWLKSCNLTKERERERQRERQTDRQTAEEKDG